MSLMKLRKRCPTIGSFRTSLEVYMNTQPIDTWRMQGSDPLGPGDEVGANDDEMAPLDPDQAPDEADEEGGI